MQVVIKLLFFGLVIGVVASLVLEARSARD
jgi:hypothetical protein